MASIIKIESSQKLSTHQEAFNKLIHLIEKKKKELTKLNEKIEQGKIIIAEQIIPLEREMGQMQRTYVIELEQWMVHPKLSQGDRDKINYLIESHLEEALMHFPEDQQLIAILNRLEADDNEEDDEAFDEFLNAFDDLFGSPNHHQQSHHQSKKQKKQSTPTSKPKDDTSLHLGKMTKKLYLDLVKKLHPDREHDDTMREHKTELMKEITLAYNDNNIHALMQLHLTHMDNEQQLLLDSMGETQVNHYIQLLKNQSKELQQQIDQIKHHPSSNLVYNLMAGTETMQQRKQNQLITEMKQRNQQFEEMMTNAHLEVKAFKKYLKTVETDPFADLFY